MTETLTHLYLYESTQRMLSNEYQHERVYTLKKTLRPCAYDEGSLSNPVIAVVLEVSLGVLFCPRY